MITEMIGHKQLHTVNSWRCRECLMCDEKFDFDELLLHLKEKHGIVDEDLIIEKGDGEIWRKINH